ncbi:hypothetical protein IMG5_151840 [Ichthyophthirius multifiliis]|uniref:Activator of Hsp90 ATPase homologue 1/2-like C-terminal domain-containing protein n=1 Tax=Ichthyophthirius multifiliis TaxID=5932 RepID=G0QYS4_ICHMU|nr:hypothetical protein IMG5_151840 [Ichthyophthirius multifiliis]EGR29635.1 hypothetical protein IMG5_151840 [Ichthyophthirius multifiliis]|eukprot:XP_004030871.1 hypothetical protein IMG5_151840 [Ichthyophthirius multifiliis]
MSQSLKFSITFEVPAKVIYNALIDPQEIMKYTRCPCQVQPSVGGQYVILEGRIIGQFTELDSQKYIIKMNWKQADWPNDSNVEFTFIDRDDECEVIISQQNIPSKVNIEQLEKGWQAQIFNPMSTICGYPIEK